MKLRPYQSDAVESAIEQFRSHQRTVGVLPTGTGKTIVFAGMADRAAKVGRVMILAHREELVQQAADKVGAFTGLPVDVEMADRKAGTLFWA